MIDEIDQKVRALNGLRVTKASFDGMVLTITFSEHGFGTTSPWRFVEKGDVVMGCTDEGASEAVAHRLEGALLIGVEKQSRHMGGDPALIFEEGFVLEVFSDTHTDPWSFSTPGLIYVGEPGDSRYNR